MFLARIYITPKSTVNDPQGLTVENSLHALGFECVEGVTIGKYMEIHLVEKREKDAVKTINAMCVKLLSNPVIEDFRFELEKLVK